MNKKERAIENHRKMWNWITDEIRDGNTSDIVDLKRHYVTQHEKHTRFAMSCYLCAYVCDLPKNGVPSCVVYCPLVWTNDSEKAKNVTCLSGLKSKRGKDTGLYSLCEEMQFNGKYKKAEILARRIANLPIRRDNK